jgi:aminopeptidase N
MSHLWDEYERGREDYDDGIWHTMREVAEASGPDPSGGMVWHYYDNAWETFRRRGNNAYSKGASVLHMLRQSLGDELFFKCLAEYTRRHAWQQAESDDLRKVIEQLSGRSYERFFQQWVYRSGAPKVRARYEWDPQMREVHLTLEQTQEITEHMPAFAADVHVWLVNGEGTVQQEQTVATDGRSTRASFRCDAEPAQVVIDPNNAVLMTIELDVPLRMLIEQAQRGPTTMSRFTAIAALSKHDRANARDVLREILFDEKLWWGLRGEAATSLGKMQSDAAREVLLEALGNGNTVKDHKTRRAVVAAIGEYRHPNVAQTLIRFAKSDPSSAVEAEAAKALRRQDATDEVIEALLACAGKSSYRDQVRTAAVESLGMLGDARGIRAAMALGAYGQPFRSRATGLEALGRLGKDLEEKRNEIRDFLVPLLRDPQERAANAAIDALGAMGDEDAIPELERIAASSAPDDQRRRAREAIDNIRRGGGESETVRSLRQRIESLEKDRDGKVESKAPAATAPATAPS